MTGLMNALVNAPMTAVNAAPITMPTARSITLPRMTKSLKPRSIDPPRRLPVTLWPEAPIRIHRSPRTVEIAMVADRGKLAGVLFDMDGTLVDSEKVWDVGLTELAGRYGGVLSADARARMVGSNMSRSM